MRKISFLPLFIWVFSVLYGGVTSAASYTVTEESDWYFTVDQDQTLVVIYGNSNQSCQEATVDPYLWLYDGKDSLIAYDDDGNFNEQDQCVSSKIYTTLDAGDYRLRAGYYPEQLGLGNTPEWGSGEYELITEFSLLGTDTTTSTIVTTTLPPTTTTTLWETTTTSTTTTTTSVPVQEPLPVPSSTTTTTVVTTTTVPPTSTSSTTTTTTTLLPTTTSSSTTTVPPTTTTVVPTTSSTTSTTSSTSTTTTPTTTLAPPPPSTSSTTTPVPSSVASTVVATTTSPITVPPTTTSTTTSTSTTSTTVPSTTTTSSTSTTTTTEPPKPAPDPAVAAIITRIQNEELAESMGELLSDEDEITVEVLHNVIDNEDFDSLDEETLEAVSAALSEAPDEVKEEFESEVNVFEGSFDTYVPTGSKIDVGTRRTVVAVTASMSAVAAAPAGGGRRRR